jgi:predicted XRE-type DNA-binding protein
VSGYDDVRVTESSGNVFADLGLPDADELLFKTDLSIAINREVHARGWTKQQAAQRVFMTLAQMSKIRRLKTAEFSIAKLQSALRSIQLCDNL